MNILILGLPNVGKTSLYNILSNDEYNIIHSTVGTTRDWHVSQLKNNLNINIYDTPGIVIDKNYILEDKFLNLIKNIDVFFYVLDYKKDNYNIDKDIINLFRKFNKEIILIVNKDDNQDKNKNLKSLGIKNVFYISCSHKIGFDQLQIFLDKYSTENINIEKFNFSIALFGKTNVGKSTLLNKLVGYDRSIVSNKPKTTTDVVSSIYKHKGNTYLIKDTAGLIKKNKIDKDSLDFYATKKTLSIIKNIDVNILLIDVEQGFDSQSKKIFNLIYQKSNILLFLINKIDLIKLNKKNILSQLKLDIEEEFSQSKNISILSISAFDKKNIYYLKNFIHKITSDIKKNIPTSEINRWLNKTVQLNPHSRVKGREVKFKYATQISDNPLTIKIFGNFSREISIQYKRFLLNNFYNYFKIKSKNVKIKFSKSNNPYK